MGESNRINEWRVAVMVQGADPRRPAAEWIGTVAEYLQANPDTLIDDLRSLMFRGPGGEMLRLGGGAAPEVVVRFMPRAKALACKLRGLGVLGAHDASCGPDAEIELDLVAEECLNFEGESGVLAEVKAAKKRGENEIEYGPFVLVLRRKRTLKITVRTQSLGQPWTATIEENGEVVYEVTRPTADRARYAALSGFGVVDDSGELTVAGRPVEVIEG